MSVCLVIRNIINKQWILIFAKADIYQGRCKNGGGENSFPEECEVIPGKWQKKVNSTQYIDVCSCFLFCLLSSRTVKRYSRNWKRWLDWRLARSYKTISRWPATWTNGCYHRTTFGKQIISISCIVQLNKQLNLSTWVAYIALKLDSAIWYKPSYFETNFRSSRKEVTALNKWFCDRHIIG